MKRNVYLDDIPLQEAQGRFLGYFAGLRSPAETITVSPAADGRVSAKPIFARLSALHNHAAPMDGVAVAAQVTFGASEASPTK